MYGKIEICNRESHWDIIKIEKNKERAEIFKKIKKEATSSKEGFSVLLEIVLFSVIIFIALLHFNISQ